MILLRPDYLVFELPSGESVPCSVEEIAAELVVESGEPLDPTIVKNAASAVLHYFKSELGRNDVSILEFTEALKRALSTFGFHVVEVPPTSTLQSKVIPQSPPITSGGPWVETVPCSEASLTEIGKSSCGVGELGFYQVLRQDMRLRLQEAPRRVRYHGLRECAQALCASKRWTIRCQRVSDEIVHFLRGCLREHSSSSACLLQIQ